jgi:hypothetical protein
LSPQSNNDEGPNFRDLYELQEKITAKIEKNTDRLSRMEKGFIALTLLVASPKIGGPDAAKLIATAMGLV